MSNNTHPLTYYERQRIEYYHRLKMSNRDVGRRIGRDHTVISRELRRNSSPRGLYRANIAQGKAELKRRKTNRRKLDSYYWLQYYVEEHLEEGWSPEQIAGRLKQCPPAELKGMTISHESIYDYIYNGSGRYLYRYLRRSKKKRQKRYSRKKQRKIRIPERVSIHQRPEEIDVKKRYGDWEGDLAAFSRQKASLAVQYERKAMLLRITKLANKSSEENERSLVGNLESLPFHLRQSMTFDNGSENVCHLKLREILNMATYFCDPYAAWQKGGVENIIGLIRKYLPRRTDLSTISDRDLYNIQELLNNRPRKTLRYLTPNEVINKELTEEVVH
jgi:IS30 family transposase